MSFLSPLFLIGAAAAAVPLLLHLLKRRPEPRVKFSAVRLLRNAPVEHTNRRRLTDLLLLALRMAALVLLAVAFARPFLRSGHAAGGGVTLVALDTSLSMSAPSRFERARALAQQAVDEAGARQLVAVMTFSDGAHIEVEPTTDRRLARSALAAAVPGFGATSYRSALNTAAELLGGRPGTIVIVTDLQESGWDNASGSIPDTADIRLVDVGSDGPNLAVTAVNVMDDRIMATVRNGGPQPRDARIRLNVEGEPVGAVDNRNPASKQKMAEATVAVGAGQSVELPLPAGRGRWAAVTVDDADGIAGDNTRYVVLDGAARPLILVVTPTGELERDAFYLQQALAVPGADGRAYVVDGLAGDQLSKWSQRQLERYRVVLLLSTRGIEPHGRELIAHYLDQGGGVFVGAGPGVDDDVLTEALGVGRLVLEVQDARQVGDPHRLAPLDVRHPVFEPFSKGFSGLALVKFARVSNLRAPQCQTIARFTTGGIALADCARGTGLALLLMSDLNNQWNDFPRHSSFVPFVHQALRYLSKGHRRAEYLVSDVPPGVPPKPGIAYPRNDSSGEAVAVNVDPRESDPRRLTADEFGAAITRIKEASRTERIDSARQAEGRQQLWRYLLGLMLITLVVEGIVAARAA
jgi:hypothetical protein